MMPHLQRTTESSHHFDWNLSSATVYGHWVPPVSPGVYLSIFCLFFPFYSVLATLCWCCRISLDLPRELASCWWKFNKPANFHKKQSRNIRRGNFHKQVMTIKTLEHKVHTLNLKVQRHRYHEQRQNDRIERPLKEKRKFDQPQKRAGGSPRYF